MGTESILYKSMNREEIENLLKIVSHDGLSDSERQEGMITLDELALIEMVEQRKLLMELKVFDGKTFKQTCKVLGFSRQDIANLLTDGHPDTILYWEGCDEIHTKGVLFSMIGLLSIGISGLFPEQILKQFA